MSSQETRTIIRIHIEIEQVQVYRAARSESNGTPVEMRDEAEPSVEMRNEPEPPSGISASTLIDLIGYEADKSDNIIEQCLVRARPNESEREMLEKLTRKKQFKNWLQWHQSTALLVQQWFHPAPVMSCLSYFCASIVKMHSDQSNTVVLAYFCGISARDGHLSATDLICHLIGQLLSWKPAADVYAKDPFEHDWEEKLKNKDFSSLLKMFTKLLKKLRNCKMVIFCLIDGITKLEPRKEEQQYVKDIFRELTKFVARHQASSRRKEDKMLFRFMVADSAKSWFGHEYFHKDEETINFIHSY